MALKLLQRELGTDCCVTLRIRATDLSGVNNIGCAFHHRKRKDATLSTGYSNIDEATMAIVLRRGLRF
jgi:hypothetical protein